MEVYIIILLKISVNEHEIMTKKINNMLHVHVHDFDTLIYADLHFCYLFKNNSVHTHDYTYILSVWQFDKTIKIKSTCIKAV